MPLHLVPRRLSPWLIGVGSLVCILVVLGLALPRRSDRPAAEAAVIPTLKPLPMAELARYAGTEACASCHSEIFKTHEDSHHAHAMSRVDAASHGERFRRPSNVIDPRTQTLYQTGVQGDRCVLTATSPGKTTTALTEYAFGSGKHAITYTGRQDGTELELRLSYYAKARRWAFSPGQQAKEQTNGVVAHTGLIKPAETVEGCFVCHSTIIAKENEQLLPETTMMGVNCEACHGPGKEHVEAMQRGERQTYLWNLKSLSPQQISLQLCSQCHRSPAGEDPHDPFNRLQLPRLQGLALPMSRCYTESKGKLSCLSCHDAHDQSPKPQSVYNLQCGSCHSGVRPEEPPCPVQPKGDCVSCHMPAQGVGMPFGLKYRTHLIKVWEKP